MQKRSEKKSVKEEGVINCCQKLLTDQIRSGLKININFKTSQNGWKTIF